MLNCARDYGRKDGFAEGLYFFEQKAHPEEFELAHINCADRYAFKQKEFDNLSFPIMDAINRLSTRGDGIAALREVFEVAGKRAPADISDVPTPPSDEDI